MLCASLFGGEEGHLPNCHNALAPRLTLALTFPLAQQGHAPRALPAEATLKVTESKLFLAPTDELLQLLENHLGSVAKQCQTLMI